MTDSAFLKAATKTWKDHPRNETGNVDLTFCMPSLNSSGCKEPTVYEAYTLHADGVPENGRFER